MIYETKEVVGKPMPVALLQDQGKQPEKSEENEKVLKFKYQTAYLPEGLCLARMLRKHPIEASKLRGASKPRELVDNLAFVIGAVSSSLAKRKDAIIKGSSYVPINAQVLQNRVRDYKPFLEWAVEHEILECDGYYIPGEKSRGYKFHPKWNGKFRVHPIFKTTLVNAQAKHLSKQVYEAQEPFLWQNFEKIRIDMEGVLNEIPALKIKARKDIKSIHLSDWKGQKLGKKAIKKQLKYLTNQRVETWLQNAERINNQEWFFGKDDKVGRLHTNITSLKKEFRKHLHINGQKLIEIDIKNSQPYLSACILLSENWDKLKMIERILKHNPTLRASRYDLTNPTFTPFMLEGLMGGNLSQSTEDFCNKAFAGELYEHLMDIHQAHIPEKEIIRDDMKKYFLKLLFTPTWMKESSKFYQILGEVIPEVLEYMEWINSGFEKLKNGLGAKGTNGKGFNCRRNDEQSSALALLLQSLESELMFDHIVPRVQLELPDAFVTTIHDSILTTPEHEQQILQIMKDQSKVFLGREASFGITKY